MCAYKLDNISTRAPEGMEKELIQKETKEILEKLDELQNLLYAEKKHSVLIVIQGMDASGKDGAIRNVCRGINPLGVMVKSFKAPTPEEYAHDFLWRIHPHTPAKGMIQIFNRSHYEDILITRVHKWCDEENALKRMKAINDFEELLQEHNDTRILKFYLHISQKEQADRLQERSRDLSKMWKYNENDFKEAKLWKDYIKVYEECFDNCQKVPWIIVPSDQNWYKEYIIANTLFKLLKSLDMQYPGIKK